MAKDPFPSQVLQLYPGQPETFPNQIKYSILYNPSSVFWVLLWSPPSWIQKASKGMHSGTILFQFPNHLNWLFSMQRSTSLSPSSFQMPSPLTLFLRLRLITHPVKETYFSFNHLSDLDIWLDNCHIYNLPDYLKALFLFWLNML